MSDVTISFTCRNKECGESLEMDVTDVERGHDAHIGLPEDSYPGEGPNWAWPKDVTCGACGAVHDEAWMELELSGVVMETIDTPDDDGPEYDPMDMADLIDIRDRDWI